jgi:hypothetical protein
MNHSRAVALKVANRASENLLTDARETVHTARG